MDSMANLYLGTGHTRVKGLGVEVLAATLDSMREKFCPNAPSSRAYTHQCPGYHSIPPGSTGHRVPRVGWRQTLQHESQLLEQVTFVCGGSGSLRYKHKSRKCMTACLKQVAGWKNLHSGIYAGGRPRHWVQELRKFRHDNMQFLTHDSVHNQFLFPASWKLIVMDDSNELMPGGSEGSYYGLTEEAKKAYDELHEEALRWGSRVYVYPDCSRAFRMPAQLDTDARRIADRMGHGGWHTISGRPFWESIEPFCVSRPGTPEVIDHWHHGERGFGEPVGVLSFTTFGSTSSTSSTAILSTDGCAYMSPFHPRRRRHPLQRSQLPRSRNLTSTPDPLRTSQGHLVCSRRARRRGRTIRTRSAHPEK